MLDKHTILLVDDEENILNSIYRLLRREKSYEILMAKSGADGLEILKQRMLNVECGMPNPESKDLVPNSEFRTRPGSLSSSPTRGCL